MVVHVSLRRTHNELANRECQRLRVDMNYHARPPERQCGITG